MTDPGPLPLATWAEGFGLDRAAALDEIAAGRLQVLMLPPPEHEGARALIIDDDDMWSWAWVDAAATIWWLLAGSPRALDALAVGDTKAPGLADHIAQLRAETGYGPGRLQ